MSTWKTLSILAALAFTNGLAAAEGPSLPAPEPELGALAITIEAKPPAKIGKMSAVQVFFVNLDSDPDPSKAVAILPSNYSDGNQVYLLNTKPGRYVAVVARLRNPMNSGNEFHGFLSQEMIPRTEITVVAGRLAFMGKFSVQTSTKMRDADPAQAHYFRLIQPERAQGGFAGAFTAGMVSAPLPYIATLTKAARDTQTAEAFWMEAAKDSFKSEPSWQELVRREIDNLKK